MNLFDFLNEHQIGYLRLDHPPVFTCEEARDLVPEFDGAQTKNLFVKDKKGRHHFLVVVGSDKNVDLKALSKQLGTSSLSLASSDRLKKYLDLEPGSVPVLGLFNDKENAVQIIVDADLWQSSALGCHPLINTSTLVIPRADLARFIEATGHELKVMTLPQLVESEPEPAT